MVTSQLVLVSSPDSVIEGSSILKRLAQIKDGHYLSPKAVLFCQLAMVSRIAIRVWTAKQSKKSNIVTVVSHVVTPAQLYCMWPNIHSGWLCDCIQTSILAGSQWRYPKPVFLAPGVTDHMLRRSWIFWKILPLLLFSRLYFFIFFTCSYTQEMLRPEVTEVKCAGTS